MKRRQLASSVEEHAKRVKTARRAVENLSRTTIATANADQCGTAFEKFASLAYWTGALEAEEIGADDRGRAFDEGLLRQFSRAKQALRTHCMLPARPARRRR